MGDGAQRAEAEAFVRSSAYSESVRFLGERRDIPQVLRAFDLFAYYTTKDALGNVILEALAAGLPVVTTDVEGTREAMQDAPGKLVPLGDLQGFARAVARCIRKPGKRKPYRLPKKFRRSEMGNQYSKLYESLTSQASSPRVSPPTDESLGSSSRHKILIKFPTRGRPDQFFRTLDKYLACLSGDFPVDILVSCDTDDPSMNTPSVQNRLEAYKNLRVRFDANKTKIQAINVGLEECEDFSILVLVADDMVPETQGFDRTIVQLMNQHFPDGDGVLFFNDGYRGRELNTLPVMGFRYYKRFGYIYHPDYKSLWADNEFTEVADRLGRQVYVPDVIIRHHHPLNVGQRPDELFCANERWNEHDRAVYLARKAQNFGLPMAANETEKETALRLDSRPAAH